MTEETNLEDSFNPKLIQFAINNKNVMKGGEDEKI